MLKAPQLPTVSEDHQPESHSITGSIVSALSALPEVTKSATLLDAAAVRKDDNVFLTQRAGKLTQEAPKETEQVVSVVGNELLAPIRERRAPQSTLIAQKKIEMQQIQALLEKKRLEFKARMLECAKKREELRVKQKQIRDRVLKFEKFLKENDSKRQRALLKAQSERKFREQKETEHQSLQLMLKDYQVRNVQFRARLSKYQAYEEYLQSVVNALPADYLDVHEPHIYDILMRYKTLKETNDDLRSIAHTNGNLIEENQTRLNALLESKDDQMLLFNSQLSDAQKRLDRAKAQTAVLEQRADEKGRSGVQKLKTLSEAMLAIDNIYARVQLSFNLAAISRASNQMTLGGHVITANGIQTPMTGDGDFSVSASTQSNLPNMLKQKSSKQTVGSSQSTRHMSVSAASTGEGSSSGRRASNAKTPQPRRLGTSELSSGSPGSAESRSSSIVPQDTEDSSKKQLEQIAEEDMPAPSQPAMQDIPANSILRQPVGMSPIVAHQQQLVATNVVVRPNVPLGDKITSIQDRLVDLIQIVDKAQHYIALEKQKKAEMAQLRLELLGGISKEEKIKEKEKMMEKRRQMVAKMQHAQSDTASKMSLISSTASRQTLNA